MVEMIERSFISGEGRAETGDAPELQPAVPWDAAAIASSRP